jgi:hypothetical protein
MHTESFPIDDLAHLLGFGEDDPRVHPPLPGLGNRTHRNKPSRPLGFHIFVGIHLTMRYIVILPFGIATNRRNHTLE